MLRHFEHQRLTLVLDSQRIQDQRARHHTACRRPRPKTCVILPMVFLAMTGSFRRFGGARLRQGLGATKESLKSLPEFK